MTKVVNIQPANGDRQDFLAQPLAAAVGAGLAAHELLHPVAGEGTVTVGVQIFHLRQHPVESLRLLANHAVPHRGERNLFPRRAAKDELTKTVGQLAPRRRHVHFG